MNDEITKIINDKLKDINTIIDNPQYNNAGFVSQIIMDMMVEFPIKFADIEMLFRKMQSRVRLIGLPLKLYNGQYIAKRPNDETFYEYGLWVGMNGPEELAKLFKDSKLSEADIDVNLDKTGFLFMGKSG